MKKAPSAVQLYTAGFGIVAIFFVVLFAGLLFYEKVIKKDKLLTSK